MQANHQAHAHAESRPHHREREGRGRWVFVAFVLIGAVLLAVEHRTHLLGWLPWLFLLACPLMHLFMHGGHGGHGGHHGGRGDGAAGDKP